jgi:hypothetical protein
MRFNASTQSTQRFTRLHRWAMLWLRWLRALIDGIEAVMPLSAQALSFAHKRLDRIERVVVSLALLRATPRVRRSAGQRGFHAPRRDAGFMRALLGVRVRRALRSKDLRTRIAALAQGAGALAARLLKRLPCGLTRLRPIMPRVETRAQALPRDPECVPALRADTS